MKDEYVARVGVWGQRHYQYLKECKPSVIGVMRLNGNLNAYLQQVNEQAEEMCCRLVKQMAKDEGVTEELKRRDQMAWGAGVRWTPLPKAEAPTEPAGETGAMNNIRERATEVVNAKVIFV